MDVRTVGNDFSVLGLGARFKISQKERKLSGWTREECLRDNVVVPPSLLN